MATRAPAHTATAIGATGGRVGRGLVVCAARTSVSADSAVAPARSCAGASGTAPAAAVEPALLLSLTLPGIPVVFAGDELGLVGRDGEESRTPMPWDSLDAAADRIALYTELIHLKRDHSALNGGSLRWLHIGDDVLAFVREDTHESLLVVVSRAEFEFDIDSAAVSARASKIRGTAQFIAAGDRVTVSGSGMSATVWSLAVH